MMLAVAPVTIGQGTPFFKATPETRGHGTHTWAKFWKQDLVELIARSERH